MWQNLDLTKINQSNFVKYILLLQIHFRIRRSLHGIMVKVLDCVLKVIRFKLQSLYYVYFQTYTLEKEMNSFSYELNSTITFILKG